MVLRLERPVPAFGLAAVGHAVLLLLVLWAGGDRAASPSAPVVTVSLVRPSLAQSPAPARPLRQTLPRPPLPLADRATHDNAVSVETAREKIVSDRAGPEAAQSPPRFDVDYLENPAPPYPHLSRRLGEEGRVLVRVLVDQEGRPRTVALDSSSGHSRLDNAAIQTVRRWRFIPARHDDRPVSEWVVVPVMFSLRG